jgi:hypothetical protein
MNSIKHMLRMAGAGGGGSRPGEGHRKSASRQLALLMG